MNVSEIKVFSKEQRRELASIIRKDPELYNVVNGIGGLSEASEYGRLIGTITENNVPITKAIISHGTGGKTINRVYTNQYGFYMIDLSQGFHTITVSSGENQFLEEVEIINGKTSILDHDFGNPEEVPEKSDPIDNPEPTV